MMTIKIVSNQSSYPIGKVADVELHFEAPDDLAGLKLIGFAIWERRNGQGRNVTFPARSYAVNGERRSFALLRPIEVLSSNIEAGTRLRDRILDAYADFLMCGGDVPEVEPVPHDESAR
jgi:hypothetical protein